MKLDCEVIRDLLPLYAEHMASPASTALVEEHLQECEACRAELEQMQLPVPVQPEPQPDAPLKGIRTALRKKRILTAAAAVLAVLCAVVLVFWMGNLSTPVTAEEAGIWLYNKKEMAQTSACWKCRARMSGWRPRAGSAGARNTSPSGPCGIPSPASMPR